MNKLIVYTCVTNNYDALRQPSSLPPWADWKAFSQDDFEDDRFPKLQPHKVFPDYEYSLWIDGNIDILSDDFWRRVDALMAGEVPYAGLPHPLRDDVYDESLRILRNDREKMCTLMRTVRFLKKEGFPRHFGLNENAIILRRHLSAEIVEFDDLWWEMFCRFSRRDQMTWSYCKWKCSLDSACLIPPGANIRNHEWFSYTPHGVPYKKNLYRDALRKVKVLCFRLWLRHNQ